MTTKDHGPFVTFGPADYVDVYHPTIGHWTGSTRSGESGRICTGCSRWFVGTPRSIVWADPCIQRCVHCNESKHWHPAGWCLFRPTRFTPVVFRVKLDGEFVDGP